ncbi:hypothetical protein niasHT_025617 [Heterodera trifolii]|uniref:40S ribosomal protein SA n=1 Tax=Heterodera trifolii TaxID=157864 RepID=A0ABD2KHN1_9BILA
MEHYVWKRRSDGIHIINIRKTWEKLLFAARAIAAIENPADVVVVSAQPYAQRAVLKFAAHIGATPIVGRFTSGSLTNQIQKNFKTGFVVDDKLIMPDLYFFRDPQEQEKEGTEGEAEADITVKEGGWGATGGMDTMGGDFPGVQAEPVKLDFEVPHITDWAAASSDWNAPPAEQQPQAQQMVVPPQPTAQAPSAVSPSAIAPPQSAAVAPPPPQPIQQHQPMPTQQQKPPKQQDVWEGNSAGW